MYKIIKSNNKYELNKDKSYSMSFSSFNALTDYIERKSSFGDTILSYMNAHMNTCEVIAQGEYKSPIKFIKDLKHNSPELFL